MIIDAKVYTVIELGRLGENNARKIRFDLRSVLNEFPHVSITLLNKRHGDEDSYPVNEQYCTLHDGYLLWTVQSGDLAFEGSGECEVICVDGETVVKDIIYETHVSRALDGNGTPPDPWQSWQQEVIEYARKAGLAIIHYPRIGMLGNWEVWDVTEEAWVDTEIPARGPKGETGNGIESVTLNNDYTLTFLFTNGGSYTTTSIRGKQGEKGDPGEDGEDGYTPVKGVDYFDGADGHSPVVTATKDPGTGLTTIYVDGSPIAIIADGINGVDGQDGQDGSDGSDGFSPTVTVTDVEGGHRITITDAAGPHEFTVFNGINGTNGVDGNDGFSPVVSVEDIENGHRVTVTDAPGNHTFDVLDGTSNLDDEDVSTEKVWSSKKTNDELDKKAPVIFNNAVGNPAVFSDGADGLPIQSLKVHLLPRQEGTGDPSPQNIRSILPWNGLTVNQCGKNLFNEAQLLVDGISLVDGYYTGKRNAFYYAFGRNGNKFSLPPFKPNTQYTMRATGKNNGDTGGSWIVIHYTDNSSSSTIKIEGTEEQTKIVTTNYGKTISHIDFTYPSSGDTVLSIKEIMFEEGTTASEYVPYHPITETDISFPSPVYGGTLDVVSGVLQARQYDSVTFRWGDATNRTVIGNVERRGFVVPRQVKSQDDLNEDPTARFCSVAPWGYEYSSDNVHYYGGGWSFYVFLPVGTDEDFEFQLVAERPLQPQEITLTPEQITALVGDNTIWSDANGDIDVEYRADTGLFLKQNTVKDVQIDGTTILQSGIATIPKAGVVNNVSTLGVCKPGGMGITFNSGGEIYIVKATSAHVKAGTNYFNPITPQLQHESVFYALAKLAGADMAQSSNAVGTFTDEALQAIQKLFGFAGLLGPYEDDITADRAYAIGETFVMDGKRYRATDAIAQGGIITPGSNCEPAPIDGNYVRFDDKAGYDSFGVVRILQYGGLQFDSSTGALKTSNAGSATIKAGTNSLYPLCPNRQHEAVFFGLAKAANVDMASLSDVTVGQYPQAQKTAIQTMLGIEADIPLIEEVSGSTPSITGMPNVRYVCGIVSTLTITPPASGSIVVRFHSGSTATVLTVPNTVKFPVWFDYTELEADTTYEIIITDGVYGGVMSWA